MQLRLQFSIQKKYFPGIYDYYMHSYLIIPYRNNVNCRLVVAVKKVLLLTFGLFHQVISYRNCKISNNICCDIDMK